jgi:DNA modification methylase
MTKKEFGKYGRIYHGNCMEILPQFKDNIFTSCVTDPPYELGFMQQEWDKSGIAYSKEFWKLLLSKLNHGATLLSFAGTRTQHKIAITIEDSGFNLKDILMWLYGQGMPKGTNIGKSNDEFTGMYSHALKPAYEPIIMAMKPNIGSYANNAKEIGIAGINIDSVRIPTTEPTGFNNKFADGKTWNEKSCGLRKGNCYGEREAWCQNRPISPNGRYPSNIILGCECDSDSEIHDDNCPCKIIDNQSGITKGGGRITPHEIKQKSAVKFINQTHQGFEGFHDEGGASRYFNRIYFVAKAISERDDFNNHPTLKPILLMQHLIKLVSQPKTNIIIDPFGGSGSTAIAAIREKKYFVLIEQEPNYFDIACKRIEKEISKS